MLDTSNLTRTRRETPNSRRKASLFRLWIRYTMLALLFIGGVSAFWFFFTSSGNQTRYLIADTLITTQHRHWAKYLIGQHGLDLRVQQIHNQFDAWAEIEIENPTSKSTDHLPPSIEDNGPKPLIEIESIEGEGFKGHLLTVNDPKKLRISVPGKTGKGEKVSSMAKRLGAVAGVNGGGFVDPEWMGNGFQPDGIVMSGGNIYYNANDMKTSVHVVGIDREGQLIAGKYSAEQLLEMGVQEAVTFAPRFIVNGTGLIKNKQEGWGIAPRTSIAQKEDGTIMFAIIDGRQPGHSLGATLYDIQNIFLERGAVIAANLDGGSSTVLVHHNEILNKPANKFERYLPTAWLVFENPEEVEIVNIWEGLDISEIDPSAW